MTPNQIELVHISWEKCDPVGTAWRRRLEKALGGAFTAETKEAWLALSAVLATSMENAAARPAPASARFPHSH